MQDLVNNIGETTEIIGVIKPIYSFRERMGSGYKIELL